eukprot:4515692-Lingulodinium_polyedra.AAC.1
MADSLSRWARESPQAPPLHPALATAIADARAAPVASVLLEVTALAFEGTGAIMPRTITGAL